MPGHCAFSIRPGARRPPRPRSSPAARSIARLPAAGVPDHPTGQRLAPTCGGAGPSGSSLGAVRRRRRRRASAPAARPSRDRSTWPLRSCPGCGRRPGLGRVLSASAAGRIPAPPRRPWPTPGESVWCAYMYVGVQRDRYRQLGG